MKVHLAGPVVFLGQRKIQRCCVCGVVLYDNGELLLADVPGADKLPYWPVMEHVAVIHDTYHHIDKPADGSMPEGFCARDL